MYASSTFVGKYFPRNLSVEMYNCVYRDYEAGYSWTAQNQAAFICDFIHEEARKIWPDNNKTPSIVDATAGAGGNSAAFMCCRWFRPVTAVEISERRYAILKQMMTTYRKECVQAEDVHVTVVQGNIKTITNTSLITNASSQKTIKKFAQFAMHQRIKGILQLQLCVR